ncbi:unnamed protein product [Rhizophagus irregularis]|uniref:Protein kinase domain-containing protein n=1 Tax=Rhizophagus irregularis TaxID=588596 RepID=A0A915YNC9_9GLOM|nr:unnamed protein product [Rhizophagus irregularis]
METINPDRIVEWIPYNNLQNINYLTRGGCSEIYTAVWTDGRYDEWDSKAKQLERFGRQRVILKKLENVERANRSWFEECKSHLSISSKCGQVVQCYEEQEAFHSKTYNYNIPYNIDNFINKNNDNASKSINIIEDDNKELSEVTEIIQINYSNSNNVQNDYKKEIIQQVKKHNFDYIDDENEIYNNPNLHSEEQDELVIPDDGF